MQEDANLNGIGDACEGLDQGSGLTSIFAVPQTFNRFVGDKRYELSNHLGNVLSVVSDRKLFQNTLSFTTFAPDVLSYSDYYPFGMLVPNRHKAGDDYRYGFQGQEKDDEIRGGEGNSLNYTFRMHDPRVGRFFAVDPLSHEYPYYSPYQFSSNSPIYAVELEGLESSSLVNETEKKKMEKEGGKVRTWIVLRLMDMLDISYNAGEVLNGRPPKKYPVADPNFAPKALKGVQKVYDETIFAINTWDIAKYGMPESEEQFSFKSFSKKGFEDKVLVKFERIKIFISELEKANSPKNQKEAITLINKTLDKVEDAYSGIAKASNPNRDDGRMYGILDGKYVKTLEDGTKIAKTKGNRIVLEKDGSFEIQTKDGTKTLFKKNGKGKQN